MKILAGLLLAASLSIGAPISYTYLPVGTTGGVNTQTGGNSDNPVGANYFYFVANAGDPINLFGDRLVGAYDMSFWVLQGLFADTDDFGGAFDSLSPAFVDFGDDQDPPNIAGPFGDPHVSFIASTTGAYTVAVTNFASSGQPPYPFNLTLEGSTATVAAVPEPSTFALFGAGAIACALMRRRRS